MRALIARMLDTVERLVFGTGDTLADEATAYLALVSDRGNRDG